MDDVSIEKPSKEKLKELKVDTWEIWECDPDTFDWRYGNKESCYFLEGKVTVKTTKGDLEIGKGDFVIFPKGMECTWIVEEKVKKYYKFG